MLIFASALMSSREVYFQGKQKHLQQVSCSFNHPCFSSCIDNSQILLSNPKVHLFAPGYLIHSHTFSSAASCIHVGFATYHSLFFSETVGTAHTYLDTAGLKVRFLAKSLCSYIFSLLIYFLPLSYFNCSKGI